MPNWLIPFIMIWTMISSTGVVLWASIRCPVFFILVPLMLFGLGLWLRALWEILP